MENAHPFLVLLWWKKLVDQFHILALDLWIFLSERERMTELNAKTMPLPRDCSRTVVQSPKLKTLSNNSCRIVIWKIVLCVSKRLFLASFWEFVTLRYLLSWKKNRTSKQKVRPKLQETLCKTLEAKTSRRIWTQILKEKLWKKSLSPTLIRWNKDLTLLNHLKKSKKSLKNHLLSLQRDPFQNTLRKKLTRKPWKSMITNTTTWVKSSKKLHPKKTQKGPKTLELRRIKISTNNGSMFEQLLCFGKLKICLL